MYNVLQLCNDTNKIKMYRIMISYCKSVRYKKIIILHDYYRGNIINLTPVNVIKVSEICFYEIAPLKWKNIATIIYIGAQHLSYDNTRVDLEHMSG